eukprot:8853-Pelagomonas_calceolata.AAC.4
MQEEQQNVVIEPAEDLMLPRPPLPKKGFTDRQEQISRIQLRVLEHSFACLEMPAAEVLDLQEICSWTH